jgi:hypothetical protein
MAKKTEETTDKPTTMTKTDAVKAAIADGVVKPSDGVKYVKEKFGIDVTGPLFSIIKSQAKLKGRKKSTRVAKPADATSPVVATSRAISPTANGKHHVASSLASIKKLVDELGVDQLKEIAEMLR